MLNLLDQCARTYLACDFFVANYHLDEVSSPSKVKAILSQFSSFSKFEFQESLIYQFGM